MFELIKQLTELSGPVGQEDIVLQAVAELWEPYCSQLEHTKLGNIVGSVGGHGPRILLVAHADELCYLVRAIDDDGFLWLGSGQMWDGPKLSWRESFAIGQRVRVLARSGPIPGVIASATGHLAMLMLKEPDELTWNDIWVDTGLSSEELKARGVTPGTRVIWDETTEQFGNHVVGKALDNRGSLAILCELIKQVDKDKLGCDLSVACTIQEEIYLVGVSEIAQRGAYDAAIVLEVGLCSDIPGINSQAVSVKLGNGPILVYKDSMIHYDSRLTAGLEKVAGDSGYPIQHAVFGWYGTEGSPLMRAGIPTALVAFPTRYTHTPFETADLNDIQALLDWLAAFVHSDLSWLV